MKTKLGILLYYLFCNAVNKCVHYQTSFWGVNLAPAPASFQLCNVT